MASSTDRAFNEECDPSRIDAEWAALPAQLADMLRPLRWDEANVPAIKIGNGWVDIAIIKHCAGENLGRTLQFVVSEALAIGEGVGMEAASRQVSGN